MGSDDLVLGLQWLRVFNPTINWKERKLTIGKEKLNITQPQTIKKMTEEKLYYRKIPGKEGYKPERATEGAAGYDLRAAEEKSITPNQRSKIGLNIAIRLPKGVAGIIKPRSGLAKNGYSVDAGVIDSDYTGEISVLCVNNGNENWKIKKGENGMCNNMCPRPVSFPICQCAFVPELSLLFSLAVVKLYSSVSDLDNSRLVPLG